jgi:hypothetical protein
LPARRDASPTTAGQRLELARASIAKLARAIDEARASRAEHRATPWQRLRLRAEEPLWTLGASGVTLGLAAALLPSAMLALVAGGAVAVACGGIVRVRDLRRRLESSHPSPTREELAPVRALVRDMSNAERMTLTLRLEERNDLYAALADVAAPDGPTDERLLRAAQAARFVERFLAADRAKRGRID